MNHNSNHNGYNLEPNVLMGLTVAGVASSIIHTMMGLQTERHILSNIANKIHPTHDNEPYRGDGNHEIRNLVTDLMENNLTAAVDSILLDTTSLLSSNEIMIRTTNSPKLQYDLFIRVIGTAIIFYYSIHTFPFHHHLHHTRSHYQKERRLDVIGTMGVLFVVIFLIVQLVPILLPLYEWMRILLIVTVASPVINDLFMHHTARIHFIMSGQIVNFVTTLLVRYICESVVLLPQGAPWLSSQHIVTSLLATLAAVLFVVAQNKINRSGSLLSVRDGLALTLRPTRIKVHTEDDDDNEPKQPATLQRHHSSPQQSQQPLQQPRSLTWHRIIRDMFYSNNVQRWIIMQTLLEVQISVTYLLFLYTILYEMEDHNVRDTRFLWTLFRIRKVDTILIHIPMLLFHYSGVYYTLFVKLFGVSMYAYYITDQPANAMTTIHVLTIIYYISCMSVHSAAFNVAMADLTLSIRYDHSKSTDNHHRRSDNEPNIAGILIAYSSFICKPITYFISGIVATMLRNGRATNALSSTAFHVLIYATIISSSIQLYVWRRYDLVKHRTTSMRDELFQIIPK